MVYDVSRTFKAFEDAWERLCMGEITDTQWGVIVAPLNREIQAEIRKIRDKDLPEGYDWSDDALLAYGGTLHSLFQYWQTMYWVRAAKLKMGKVVGTRKYKKALKVKKQAREIFKGYLVFFNNHFGG